MPLGLLQAEGAPWVPRFTGLACEFTGRAREFTGRACGVRTGSVKILVLFTHFHGHLVLAMNWRSWKFTFRAFFHVVAPESA